MLGPRVFCRPRPRWGIFFRAKYDNVALRAVLRDQFGELTLADIQQKGKAVLVTAFNVTSGNPRLFKTDHSDNLTRDGDLTLVDVALASTAAPMYFPVVSVTNPRDSVTEAFCDGGVVANHPTLLAYAEAVSEFRANPAEIRILSLSTPRKHLGEGSVAARSLDRGWLSWRKTLPDILIDSNSKIAHEVLRRIVESYSPDERPLYERVLLHNAHSLAMDCADEAATNELESLGASAAGANDTRGRLQPIIKEPTHG
jgi:predicted acylesterase/phospholipase RssA